MLLHALIERALLLFFLPLFMGKQVSLICFLLPNLWGYVSCERQVTLQQIEEHSFSFPAVLVFLVNLLSRRVLFLLDHFPSEKSVHFHRKWFSTPWKITDQGTRLPWPIAYLKILAMSHWAKHLIFLSLD